MDASDRPDGTATLDLLARGGLVPPDGRDDDQRTDVLPRYEALRDPAGAEQLGRQLAGLLRDHDPGCVLIWQHPQDLVLGHIVARELSVPAVRSYDQDGLVGFEGSFGQGRVVLVGDAFRDGESVRAMCALAQQRGQQVVAAAALAAVGGSGAAELARQGVELVTLIDLQRQVTGHG